jgi:hypothetical protein
MGRAVAAGIVAVVGLSLIAGCGNDSSSKSSKTAAAKSASARSGASAGSAVGTPGPDTVGSGDHAILFEAIGSGAADVAYVVGESTAQDSGMPLPWHKTVRTDMAKVPASMMISATEAGALSCRVTVDGTVVTEVKAEAGQKIVGCKTP